MSTVRERTTKATAPAAEATERRNRNEEMTHAVCASSNESGEAVMTLLSESSPADVDEEELRDIDEARSREVQALCEFQRRAIKDLDAELEELDAEILEAEADVLEKSNRIHGLRGLMQMRRNKALAAGEAASSDQTNSKASGGGLALDPEIFAVGPRERSRDFRGNRQQPRVAGGSKMNVRNAPGSVLGGDSERIADSASGCEASDAVETDGSDPVPVIGMVYSQFSKRYEAPRQSFQGPAGKAVVVLPGAGGESSNVFDGVVPGAHVWILYHFDRNAGFWREMVRPPRALGGWRVGVFATRSPHRPTPIGLSLAEVVSVDLEEDARIFVKGVDILDETPVVGWRLYRKETESHKGCASGWLDNKEKLQPLYYDEISAEASSCAGEVEATEEHRVIMSDVVRQKLLFIDEKSTIDVFGMLGRSLGRIVRDSEGHLRARDGRSEVRPFPSLHDGSSGDWNGESGVLTSVYPVGAWRIWFGWDSSENAVRIVEVSSGIRKEVVRAEGAVDREVREHREFSDKFGQLLL